MHPATVLGLGDGAPSAACCATPASHVHADPLGPQPQPGRRAAGRDRRAPPDPTHGRALRVSRRGLLAPGHLADVNIIDHGALALESPNGLQPPGVGQAAGATRRGYVATLKSGTVVREHDEATGERRAASRGPSRGPPEERVLPLSARRAQRLFEAAHPQGVMRPRPSRSSRAPCLGAPQVHVDVDVDPRAVEGRNPRDGPEVVEGERLGGVVAADGVEAPKPDVSALEDGVGSEERTHEVDLLRRDGGEVVVDEAGQPGTARLGSR